MNKPKIAVMVFGMSLGDGEEQPGQPTDKRQLSPQQEREETVPNFLAVNTSGEKCGFRLVRLMSAS